MKIAILAILLCGIVGCASRSPINYVPSNPLILANCPALCPVDDKGHPQCYAPDSFGDTVTAYLDLIGQYKACRAAAIANLADPK